MKNKLILFICLTSIFFLLLITIGCKDEEIKAFYITGETQALVSERIQLGVCVEPEDVTNYTVDWLSSDTSIATVKDGFVEGISAGTVTISASIGTLSSNIEITFVKKEEGNKIDKLFNKVKLITETPICYEKIELSLEERNPGMIASLYNPYDSEKIYIYGVFTSQSGKQITSPAFWYRDYEIILMPTSTPSSGVSGVTTNDPNEPQGLESVKWLSDEYEYRLRFQPSEQGEWKYSIYVAINSIVTETLTGNIDVSSSSEDYKGIVQVDKTNNRTFIFENQSSFIPVGQNIGWWTSSNRKTYDYDVWMSKMNENNMNIGRIWMAPWGFCLHWGEKYDDYTDRLNYAARLDKVIELANKYDIYIMLALLNHGQFSSNVNSTWSTNPYNVKNGGMLTKPDYFFINAEAKKAYKNELLYIIGRYGYSDNILAWELFNEVDWTDNASTNAYYIKLWHKEMANFIENNDSYNHMITTSYKGEYGAAYSLEEIDFVNPHNYGYSGKNLNKVLPDVLTKIYNTYHKPVLQCEIGMNWESGIETAKVDPNGVFLIQQSWSSMMGGGAGGAMNWWWDSWVHPNNLYYQFKGAGVFASKMDLTGDDYSLLTDYSDVTTSQGTGILGYKFDDRVYGYIYNSSWTYQKQVNEITNIEVKIPFKNGTYELTYYSIATGEVISSSNISCNNGYLKFTTSTFTNGIAFIIK